MTTTINASTSAGLVNTADTSGVLALQTAGTTAVTIDASQNVGIGTASPAGKLEVNGLTFLYNSGSTTSRLLLRNTTTGVSSGGLDIQQVSSDASINNASNGYMSFSTNNTERMRVFSSGGVSIGNTTDPGATNLSVTGKVTAALVAKTGTYTPGTTTPSVAGVSVMVISNSTPTTISNFLNGSEGQILYLSFSDTNTTINRSSTLLVGSVNYTSVVNGTLVFIKVPGAYWTELSRSSPG